MERALTPYLASGLPELAEKSGEYHGTFRRGGQDPGTTRHVSRGPFLGGAKQAFGGYSIAESGTSPGSATLNFVGSSATPLGGNWYDLGSVPLTSGDTSISLNFNDSSGSVPTAVCLLQQTSTTVYDLNGNVTSQTDALGRTTTSSYDHLDRLQSVTQPATAQHAAPVTSCVYDAAGDVIEVDAPGPNGQVATKYEYNMLGQRTVEIDPDPATGLADLGGGSPVTTTTYDAVGNVTSTTDPLGNTTTYAYNANDELLTQTDPAVDVSGTMTHPVTTYTYDADGEQTSLTDSDNNTTTSVYDSFGRVVKDTNQLGANDYYTYDAAGNLLQEMDRDQRVTAYSYDNLNQMTAETWYQTAGDVTNDTPYETIGYSYDLDGETLNASEASISYPDGVKTATTVATDAYSYDSFGRTATDAQSIAGPAPAVTLASQYDANGNRTQLAATIGSTPDFANNYAYDALNEMTQVTQSGVSGGNGVAEKRVDLAYDVSGELSGLTRYADLTDPTRLVATSTYGYDASGRLTGLTHQAGDGTMLAAYHLAYDQAGQVTDPYSYADAQATPTSDYTTWGHAQYGYDTTGQLTGATYTNFANAPTTDASYSYDANGNQTQGDFTVAGSTNQPGDNQMTSGGTYQVPDSTTTYPYNYSYDPEGNCTLRWANTHGAAETSPQEGDLNVTTYTWDNRNRLVEVDTFDNFGDYRAATQRPSQVVKYTYDAFNRWTGETVTNGAGAVVSQREFAYDGNEIVLSFDGTGSLTNRYLWGPAVDQLLAQEQALPSTSGGGAGGEGGSSLLQAGTVDWALTDNQGTVRDLATYDPSANDGAGATTVATHRVFDAFGNQTSQTQLSGTAVDCLFGYTGEAYDKATGLQNNLNRSYDASVGRWLSEDPSGLGPDSNPYRYCGNGPTDGTDARGLTDVTSPKPFPGATRTPDGTYTEHVDDGQSGTVELRRITDQERRRRNEEACREAEQICEVRWLQVPQVRRRLRQQVFCRRKPTAPVLSGRRSKSYLCRQ